MKIIIRFDKEVTKETLENIFVTALEGGSNDWYWLTDDTVAKIRKYVSRKDEPTLSVATFKAVMDFGAIVKVHDKEFVSDEDPEILGELNHNTIKERLQKLANDPNYSYALIQEIDGNGDAATSDVVFQYLVMNECIFS